MSEAQLASYEAMPYTSRPFATTHPDTLATVATLFGMHPAPPGRCRVLELGCALGGNLIPMALALPQSTFVGIDLSPSQIAEAQRLASALGLPNLTLRAASILDVDTSWGQFDYVICHGVYSWVPRAVQDKILAICRENLAPQGVAYVSYNTFPGWHLKGLLRGVLQFHASHFDDASTRIRQSRAFLDLMSTAVKGANTVYGRLLAEDIEELQPEQDTYLYHEYLEDVNEPLYFHEFVERASAKGLQYLDEARQSQLPSGLPPEALRTLNQLPVSLIHREQYLDFIRGRSFRRTLLCHAQTPLHRPPSVSALMEMYLTGIARPARPDVDITSPTPEEFQVGVAAPGLVHQHSSDSKSAGLAELRGGTARTATTNDPLLKAALVSLSRGWPKSIAFRDLWNQVEALLTGASEAARARLAEGPACLAASLLQCWMGEMIEAHVDVLPFVTQVSERPLASPLARLQAAGGGLLTNLRHWSVQPDDFDRLVLLQLDGSRDRRAILDALCELVNEGALTLEQDGKALRGAAARPLLERALTPSLQFLANSALLIG